MSIAPVVFRTTADPSGPGPYVGNSQGQQPQSACLLYLKLWGDDLFQIFSISHTKLLEIKSRSIQFMGKMFDLCLTTLSRCGQVWTVSGCATGERQAVVRPGSPAGPQASGRRSSCCYSCRRRCRPLLLFCGHPETGPGLGKFPGLRLTPHVGAPMGRGDVQKGDPLQWRTLA